MVGQRILVPYVRVQLLPPQPVHRPHRLTVRTPASHVGSPGSNPGGVTSLRFLTEATARQATFPKGSEGCRVEAFVGFFWSEDGHATQQEFCYLS